MPAEGYIDSLVGSEVGDGRPASDAIIDPRGLALQPAGSAPPNLIIADGSNHRVRLINSATGIASTIGGTGQPGFAGDNGGATSAQLRFPTDVVVDSSGNIYVADSDNNRVRRITPGGIISTYAGNGSAGSGGDGGLATQANLWAPRGLALDSQGNLYIAEFSGNRIRKVSTNGIISRVAGTGTWGSSGDGGQALNGQLANPAGVAVDSTGNIYIADYNNSRIRRVATDGVLSTIAGDGFQGFTGDGGAAQASRIKLPYRLRFDGNGNLVFLDYGNNRVRRIQAVSGVVTGAGTITTIAGNGSTGSAGDGNAANSASFWYLNGLAVDASNNNVYLGVTVNQVPSPENRVRVVSASGIVNTQVGGGNGDGGPAIHALIDPRGIATGGSAAPNLLYVADGNNSRVRLVDLGTGIVSTVAGTGTAGWSGDGGAATNAQLKSPFDVARDTNGNLWIADTLNNRIRKVTPNGTISTAAGTGSYGYGGDNGSATAASFAYPYGVAVDASGSTVYVADFGNNRIRKIAGGQATTIAGNGNWGYSGDGGLATSARLSSPTDVAVGPDGLVYIADYSNHVIRRVRADGIIERVAGNATSGFSGDGGLATNAQLNLPSNITFDSNGNLLIGDAQNKRVRRVDASTGIITTLVGTGTGGTEGDGGLATQANIYRATGLGTDNAGHLFISQSDAFRVRVTTLATSTQNSGIAVSGAVRYFSNQQPVSNVTVHLQPANGQAGLTATSDANGNYRVDRATTGNWDLTPVRDENAFSSITALDATYALEATVGNRTITGLQRLACDVNGNGSITAIDASLILQLRVGIIQQLPVATNCGSDWGFFPNTTVMSPDSANGPVVSSGQCSPGEVHYNPLDSSVSAQDFSGILFGDCNGSWQPTGGGASLAVARSAVSAPSVKFGRARRGRHSVSIPVLLDGSARSIELTLQYDPSRLATPSVQRGTAAIGGLMQTNPNTPGELRIALAKITPFEPGTILHLRFHTAPDQPLGSALRVVHAAFDGE